MELRDFVVAMRRRWYLTLAALMACAATGLLMLSTVPPSYSAEATTLLLPPATQATAENPNGPDNPLLFLGGLTQTRDVLMRRLRSEQVIDQVAKVSDATYEVSQDLNSSGPVVVITAEAPTSKQAVDAANLIQRVLPELLTQLQTELGVTKNAQILSFPLTASPDASISHKSQIRLAIVAVAAVGLSSFVLIGLIDGVITGRRRRRRSPRRSGQGRPLRQDETSAVPTAPPLVAIRTGTKG